MVGVEGVLISKSLFGGSSLKRVVLFVVRYCVAIYGCRVSLRQRQVYSVSAYEPQRAVTRAWVCVQLKILETANLYLR